MCPEQATTLSDSKALVPYGRVGELRRCYRARGV